MLFLYRSGPYSHRFSPVDDLREIVKAGMRLCSLYFSSSLSKLRFPVRWGKRIYFAEIASLSLIGVCGESKDKADATASCLSKQENQRNPRESWSFKAFAESHDVWPHVLYVPCSSTGCTIAEATPVFPRSFSPAAAVGVLVARSRRRLHRLWAGSKIRLPVHAILRHHLLRHVHHLGAFG